MADELPTSMQPALAVYLADQSSRELAIAVSDSLRLPLIDDQPLTEAFPLLLWVEGGAVGLRQSGRKAPNPVVIDFVGGSLGFRGKRSAHSKELVAQAVGVKGDNKPSVLDCTAGLGRDAFVLASRGCRVQMLERNPVIALLLENALERARVEADTELSLVIDRMRFEKADATAFMQCLTHGDYPEVVYLDPMFPERTKTASVKKEMKLLQQLLGADMDTEKLFEAALAVAQRRVVVKRPKLAPCISELKPHHVVEGKAGRFDVYFTRALG